jgi:Eco29kI restriction endonuclease
MTNQYSDKGRLIGLRETLSRLTGVAATSSLSASKRRVLEAEIKSAIAELGTLLNTLDPVRQPTSVFDPSNPKIVGRFVSLALVAQSRHPLAEIPRSYGSGVYAIYYRGGFSLYAALKDKETPIYVGQAAPAINNARTPIEQGTRLCDRLSDHRKNIGRASTTLSIDDFEFRSLVVQSGWETAAEDYLIHLFKPIWNSETKLVFGLGKHGDSATTRANRRSPWDTLHPGRTWAEATKEDAKSPETIATELTTHFAKHPVFPDIETVLTNFIDELRQA